MQTATLTAPPRQPVADGYSPALRITLEVEGRVLDVASTGPGFLVLRTQIDLDAADGILHVDIDGDVNSRLLRLPNGLQTERRRQPFERR